jgi:2,5-diketo-D-gluconate reductase A
LSPARMTENLDVYSFDLGPKEMVAVSALHQGEAGRIGSHPDSVDWIPGRLAS